MTSAQPIYQPGEFHKIREAEESALPDQDDLGIRRREVRPLRGHRADGPLINLEQETPAGAVGPLAYARELLPAEGMEGVGDTYKTRGPEGKICILD